MSGAVAASRTPEPREPFVIPDDALLSAEGVTKVFGGLTAVSG